MPCDFYSQAFRSPNAPCINCGDNRVGLTAVQMSVESDNIMFNDLTVNCLRQRFRKQPKPKQVNPERTGSLLG
jgi:hypothetical protein